MSEHNPNKRKRSNSDATRLDNMKNLRKAFRSIDTNQAQAATIIQATFGLIDQNDELDLTPEQRVQIDLIERQLLQSVGAEVHPIVRLTHNNNNGNRGGKSKKNKSNKNNKNNKKSRRSSR